MSSKLVFTVGNEMMGDDAAGPLLACKLARQPVGEWKVLDGGNAPENHVFKIRDMAPERVLIVDAADMNLPAGMARLIDRSEIAGLFLMTTHSLPLTYLIESLDEFVPLVEMIGIQPETVAFGYPVSAAVMDAVERVYRWLETDGSERAGTLLRAQLEGSGLA